LSEQFMASESYLRNGHAPKRYKDTDAEAEHRHPKRRIC